MRLRNVGTAGVLLAAVTLAAATAVYAQRILVGGPGGGFWRGGPPRFGVRGDFDGSFNYCRGFFSSEYFDRFSPEGYAIGVNFILYAMTH